MEMAIRCLEVALHPATGDNEAMASVFGFRRKAKGTPLSDICIELYARGEMKNRLKQANDEVLTLRASLSKEQERYEEIRRRAEEAEAQLRLLMNSPIELMNSPIESTPANQKVKWSKDEYEFLARLYETNPSAQNKMLAARCSDHFGREITSYAIGGSIDRLRKQGRLPRYRPGREREPGLADGC